MSKIYVPIGVLEYRVIRWFGHVITCTGQSHTFEISRPNPRRRTHPVYLRGAAHRLVPYLGPPPGVDTDFDT